MDDTYYYQLNGKEHGPFSRIAIVTLLNSGALTAAFIRINSDVTWRLPEELGLTPVSSKAEPPLPKPPAVNSSASAPRTANHGKNTPLENSIASVFWSVALLFFIGYQCYKHKDSIKEFLSSAGEFSPLKTFDADRGAATVIRSQLVSPASYQEISSEVFWSGKTKNGLDAYIVKVIFDSQNAFGATLRNCQVASFSIEGDNVRWNKTFSLRKCDINPPEGIPITEKDYYASAESIDFLVNGQ